MDMEPVPNSNHKFKHFQFSKFHLKCIDQKLTTNQNFMCKDMYPKKCLQFFDVSGLS